MQGMGHEVVFSAFSAEAKPKLMDVVLFFIKLALYGCVVLCLRKMSCAAYLSPSP